MRLAAGDSPTTQLLDYQLSNDCFRLHTPAANQERSGGLAGGNEVKLRQVILTIRYMCTFVAFKVVFINYSHYFLLVINGAPW